MPLSESSVKREPIHERRITCSGYRRQDGLWDIEGHLTDTKAYDFSNQDRGRVQSGEPVHEMWLRITVDDDLVIRGTEASTEYGPFSICSGAAPNFARIKDVKIGPGFRREVKRLVGGIQGCTHLRELLLSMATTAFQTIVPIRSRDNGYSAAQTGKLIGTCHAYAPDSEVVKRLWPDYDPKSQGRGT